MSRQPIALDFEERAGADACAPVDQSRRTFVKRLGLGAADDVGDPVAGADRDG